MTPTIHSLWLQHTYILPKIQQKLVPASSSLLCHEDNCTAQFQSTASAGADGELVNPLFDVSTTKACIIGVQQVHTTHAEGAQSNLAPKQTKQICTRTGQIKDIQQGHTQHQAPHCSAFPDSHLPQVSGTVMTEATASTHCPNKPHSQASQGCQGPGAAARPNKYHQDKTA